MKQTHIEKDTKRRWSPQHNSLELTNEMNTL